jgi:capsular polysaccharide transport system permease protein
MLSFFFFRRTAMQAMNAIGANKALFAYRQVKPVDTTLVRVGLEGFLMTITSAILIFGAGMLGHGAVPADPLGVAEAFAGLWLAGAGVGLVWSVGVELVPELGRVVNLLMMPLYALSGVMFPIGIVPQPYRDWLLLNPLAHGLEAARLAFVPHYHAVPGLSLGYLHGFALAAIAFGLALHVRFATRLSAQ